MRRILVTGAGGFVGSALLERLAGVAWVRAAARDPSALGRADDRVALHSESEPEAWRRAMDGVHVVIHLAARVHQVREHSRDPLAEFRATNVDWTERLATLAAQAGVERLVYLSTAKVHGDASRDPFRESDPPAPRDPYATSKWEAEQRLAGIAAGTRMQVTVLRPPLVYGPGVRANFLSLLRAVSRGMPLPIGAVHNRRSMVFVRNLADALATASGPGTASGTWLVSDGEDVSTPELVRRLARHLGRPARLLPLPIELVRACARAVGRASAAERIVGSLQVDSSALRAALAWSPPYTLDAGLAETARWFSGGLAGAPISRKERSVS